MIEASTDLKVRFAETDAMGVVYHANYLPWCECARLALIESIGLNYAKMTSDGFHLPVIEAHLNYRRPAKFGDTVTIKAAIKEKPIVKVKVDYEILADGKLLATGHTLHVFVNSSGMPIKPPKEIIKVIIEAFDKK